MLSAIALVFNIDIVSSELKLQNRCLRAVNEANPSQPNIVQRLCMNTGAGLFYRKPLIMRAEGELRAIKVRFLAHQPRPDLLDLGGDRVIPIAPPKTASAP